MKVIFVCTGNTCRSPMAEGIFKSLVQDKEYSVKSAGLSAAEGIPPTQNAVVACGEIGIDISEHKSEPFVYDESTDLFVAMTMEHALYLTQLKVPKNKIYVLDVSDPYGGDIEVYRKTRDQILKALKTLLEKIEKNGDR